MARTMDGMVDDAASRPTGPRPRTWGRFGTAITVALIIAAVWSWTHREAPTDPSSQVVVACREWVREKLRAPGTADFAGELAVQDAVGRWTVTGSVDSENAFGALLRSTWTCTATRDRDTTTLVSVDIDG